MSTITITKLYSLLSSKLGEESAENITSYNEDKINDQRPSHPLLNGCLFSGLDNW